MTLCAPLPTNAQRIELILVVMGEPLPRLEKRLSCAAAGLGLALELTVGKDAESLGIPYGQTPVVLWKGQVALSGLPRTEEIEDWLRQAFQFGNTP